MTDEKGWIRHPQSYDAPPEVDTSVPSIARVYDAFLGGKDNYVVDQRIAEEAGRVFPDGGEGARTNRRMLIRAVRYMARQASTSSSTSARACRPCRTRTRRRTRPAWWRRTRSASRPAATCC